ncbi:HIRAN domain-containing protein [Acidaminococcus fermentans]|uniref:HIRAN protein n=2 Tax=Acidaminococcus fermentans TaxID=905 RepID=D2RJM1_ACIFV|nr:HIRAN domain-containing protein [Acidaminococcus fermentans]ADB47273.1 HIRAN protein [Acidaminococcus fermentans DSM 20731]UEA72124.1 HIRAN domain-containing protein [Acidaminococcus fermentans DSM 20731]SDW53250.1 HIRAN domain-containing protein [Acidaminococcus fermentans]DAL67697.1 MAG TPA: HIRAN domain [Caudoviricetes sp.]
MKKIFITITGCNHYMGYEVFWRKMELVLRKEPDNEYDKEAIRVELPGIGKVGYVANSPHTVLGDTCSAGRIYDKIGKKAHAKVVLVTGRGVVAQVKKEK